MSPAMRQRTLDALHRLPPRRRAFAVVGLILALGCVVGLWLVQQDTAQESERKDVVVQKVTEERDETQEAAAKVIDPINAACMRSTRLAAELRAIGACQRALEADAVIEETTSGTDQGGIGAATDQVTEADVEAIVARVLARSPLLTEAQVVGVVTDYLAANPAAAGRDGRDGPSVTEVRALVAEVYAANPPPAGQDGADSNVPGPGGKPGQDGTDGRGVATAAITADGDLVLTFTDGASANLGRVDGRDGNDGPKGDPGDAGAKGDPGTARPGTYSCADDEAMRGFTIADDGAVTLDCRPAGGLLNR